MNGIRYCLLVLAAALLVHPARADAATIYLKARLEGAQANVTTNADGAGLYSYDTVTRLLSWTVTHRNLSSALTGAHLHGPAGPGEDAPIVVPMLFSASPMIGTATITAAQEADMLDGLWYVNVHTGNNPAGEIRGQLSVIDTNLYTVDLGGYRADDFLTGTVNVDPATRQMTWNIRYGVPFHNFIISVSLHGPAKGLENAPISIPFGPAYPTITGSASLTRAQVAEVVNGFWYFELVDYPLTFRAYVIPGYSHMINVSTRVVVEGGDGVAIAGFVVSGSTPKWVLVQVTGPTLANFGIANPLANPKLTLVRQSDNRIVAQSDNWQNAPVTTSFNFPMGDAREAEALAQLDQGAYTVIVESADGGTGVALVAVYEDSNPETPFINISTRGKVLQGDGVMIGGFIVDGQEPQTVVVRALGPSLAAYGVNGVLENPTLQLVRASDNAVIATNDDWQSASNVADVTASGFAPSDPRESAILITLPPGAYTGIVSGQGGGTGIGIFEVYAVPRQ